MGDSSITIYGIGGLGADHRVFKYIKITSELIPIYWIEPLEDESISSYAKRISVQIDSSQRFGIIGVSFGGMVAVELNNYVEPTFTIIISSASKSTDLPRIKSIINKLNILHFLPASVFKAPFFVLNYLFGAKNKLLLKEIISDTNPHFLKWAIGKIIKWDFKIDIQHLYQIHGSADRLIPIRNENAIIVKDGGHFMIVDKANEVSSLLNEIIRQY